MTTELKSQKQLGDAFFYGIVILLVYLVYLVFAHFLAALAWAAVLVVVTYPAYEWLARRWGSAVAAALSTVGVTLILIVPTLFLMFAFVREAVVAVQSIQLQAAGGHLAWVGKVSGWIQQRFPGVSSESLAMSARQYGEQVAQFVAARVGTVLKNTAVFLFDLGVTILAMFYLYRDGSSIVARLRELLPFELAHRDRMLSDARNLIFASVTSSLVIAAVQGALGGAAFAVAGIPAPIFWSVMIGFLSLVPVVGSAIIWVPAAIGLAVTGHLGHGILLAAFFIVIVGTVDNLMRPWLISGRAEMSGLLVFISVLGGIEVFGMLGVVLGPIVVATAASLLDLYAPSARAGNKAPSPGGN
ncbi:MAG: AI-2E family transporter [Acidobacteriia bacterium]|nr:AI-2E family transporter [Terriglobia bacterium]